MHRPISSIIIKNTRSAISLVVLFGVGNFLTFIDVSKKHDGQYSYIYYAKNLFEVMLNTKILCIIYAA